MDTGRQVNVFVSYSHRDQPSADSLKRVLSDEFRVFVFSDHRLPGAELREKMFAQIRRCEVFLLVATEHAVKSDWVRRELGLALLLQQQRHGRFPLIVPLRVDGTYPVTIIPLNPDTGEELPAISCAEIDGFIEGDLISAASQRKLDQDLFLKVELVQDALERLPDLGQQITDLYYQSFPIVEELIDPAIFLERYRRDGWQHLGFVQTLGPQLLGFISLSGPAEGPWLFGNYLAMHPACRAGGRCKDLVQRMTGELLMINPEYRGVVYEIEPVDFDFLLAATRKPFTDWRRPEAADDLQTLTEQLVRMQRLLVYQANHCRIACDCHGKPIPYRQPDMTGNMQPDGECVLWLSVRLLNPEQFLMLGDVDHVGNLLHFVYAELFEQHSYGREQSGAGPEWEAYVRSVARSVDASFDGPASLKRINIPMPIKHWYSRNQSQIDELCFAMGDDGVVA